MKSATLKIYIYGNTYEELTRKAKTEISNFLRSEDDLEFEENESLDLSESSINYEMIVSKQENGKESTYVAEVIAKIKN
jgi:hypothetical protein